MKLYIKNMVCNRCIMAVGDQLKKTGIDAKRIDLGELTLNVEPTDKQLILLKKELVGLGFEIIDDQKSKIIEQIKTIIIKSVHYNQEPNTHKLSVVISDQLNHDYSYLSNLFSSVEGTTIEKYYIAQKIERVKELLIYDELTLSEISNLLGYSSVAHLSAQFKQVTGFTASHFKNIKIHKRNNLDEL